MANDVQVIAILSDRSFFVRDIGVCIGKISNIFNDNRGRNTTYIYAGNPRINWQVEEYGRIYKIPKENMINIKISDPNIKPFNREVVTKQYLSVLEYKPNTVYMFRDSPNADTNTLVNQCKLRRIPIIAMNSNGDLTDINKPFMHDHKVYYTNEDGGGF
jgi:hypothetical protein